MLGVGIDTGGTFTDAVLVDFSGGAATKRTKVLSQPENPIRAIEAALDALGADASAVQRCVLGTTAITNLIIERTGALVGMLTTEGFKDVLEIQHSLRPNPMNMRYIKAPAIVARRLRLEVRERTLADGTIYAQPERAEVMQAVRQLADVGVDALAICFMNSYLNAHNEKRVAAWIEEEYPHLVLSLSSTVDPQVREYERFSTTVLNAYATPAITSYAAELQSRLLSSVLFMHSGGGVIPPDAARIQPIRLAMSGPAAGVIASISVGRRHGLTDLISFDMGGTSTDVCVISDGRAHVSHRSELVWGIPFRAESIDIHAVGAGGGSIAFVDPGGVLAVGPQSAGAHPGPACYGLGGDKATVTDANLLIGILSEETKLAGTLSLDSNAATKAIDQLGSALSMSTLEVSLGIHRLANARMAQLAREVTVHRGFDPRGSTLVAFGGAAGQHAYGVAELLGCRGVLFPAHASTFSALGLTSAEVTATETQGVMLPLDDVSAADIGDLISDLEKRCRATLAIDTQDVTKKLQVGLRYSGQAHEIYISYLPDDSITDLYGRFQEAHQAAYGVRLEDPAELVNFKLTVTVPGSIGVESALSTDMQSDKEPEPRGERSTVLFSAAIPVFGREALVYGMHLQGPAIVEDVDTTLVIPPHSELRVLQGGDLVADLSANARTGK